MRIQARQQGALRQTPGTADSGAGRKCKKGQRFLTVFVVAKGAADNTPLRLFSCPFSQVDNSWGKTYKGWPTSIELHMGYKRDELRRDRLDRGRQVISNTVRSSTRAPTRGGLGLSAPLNTLGSPAREDLRISSPVRMRSLRKLLKGLCCPNAPLRQHTPHAKHQGVWSFWRIRCAGDAAQHCKQAGIEEQYCGLV